MNTACHRGATAARLIVPLLVCAALAMLNVADARAENYLRFAKNEAGRATALQVAILRFRSTVAPDVEVDLIGALHVGDASYYAMLNERFERYDALLYELIAVPGTRVQPGAERRGFLAGAQLAMTDGLDLTYQLDEIDYLADNFVHADLSPDELRDAMSERGETPALFAWRLFVASMREAASDPMGIQSSLLLADLIAPRDDRSRKIAVARELMDMKQMQALLGDDEGSSIIGARNQRAVDVLQRELANGGERIGIFYGAGHMADLARRLTEDLGLSLEQTEWIDAWDLEPGATQ